MSVEALQFLTSRRSQKLVHAPGPSPEQLQQLLAAAVCAPDHSALRAWRFAVIEQKNIPAFTDLAIDATRRSGREITEQKEQNTRKWLSSVPLLIGLAYKISHDNDKVPEIEQTLSMGAAVMNIQNAAHMMGFSTYWSTGLGTYTDEVPEALGFDALDYRFVGFLAIGTPSVKLPPAQRPDPVAFTTTWQP
ncbi:nitroreductase family protein [Zwartia vadi]|uniref:nitroreductase family protein n=1 Tax=Zwartia vadi TaxID=3058168 RepID=UPI0025B39727|nr:nitroreductase [Zwartia vadi]MDN3988063.1 nitroreductase [Zwartia vadi]